MPMPSKETKLSEGAAVNAYIASLPDDVREGLRKLRSAIAAAAPGAKLGISYGVPAFKLDGRPLVWLSRGEQTRTDSVVSKAGHFCATRCGGSSPRPALEEAG